MNHRNLIFTSLVLTLSLGACSGDDTADSETTTSATDASATDVSATDASATDASATDGTTTDASTDASATDGTTTTTDPTTDATDSETSTTDPTDGAMAMIRVVHLSPDGPAVDVYANDGETPVVEGLEVKNSTDYLEVPAGDYTFAIAAAGTSLGEAVFTTPTLSLAADTMYSAVAVGKLAPNAGDGGFDVVALVDSTEGLADDAVRLQVLHAAAAAPFGQVDVWNLTDMENPEPLIENFDFKASGSLDVPSVALVIGLDVDDDGVPDASFDVPPLPAGAIVDVAAFSDDADAPSLQAVLDVGGTTQLDPK